MEGRRPDLDSSHVVMSVAAHPDDEDGPTLAYHRHEKEAITYSIIFTRGEGGQNQIGSELYEELAAIRTRETERAARMLGTQVYFLNFDDFGYAKSAEETFEKWGGRDRVVSRLVYVIRKLKPDVLFTDHDTADWQHGHHRAVALAAEEAFEWAPDPTYCADQLREEGVEPWQVKRLFRRVRQRWFVNYWRPLRTLARFLKGGDGCDVAVPVGEQCVSKGTSYADLAAGALLEHESQGMQGKAQEIREAEERLYRLERSAVDAPLHSTDLTGNLPPNRSAQIDLSYVIDSGKARALPDGALSAEEEVVVPGQAIHVQWNADLMPDRSATVVLQGAVRAEISVDGGMEGVEMLQVLKSATPTVPKKAYQYERFQNHPPVQYGVYSAEGEMRAAGYLDMEVAPPLYVKVESGAVRLQPATINQLDYYLQVFDGRGHSLQLSAEIVRNRDGEVVAKKHLEQQVGGGVSDKRTLRIALPSQMPAGTYTVALSGRLISNSGEKISATRRDICDGYVFDVMVPERLKVGVVSSHDNTVQEALKELEVDYRLLNAVDLSEGNLQGLHTIIIDIRAYLLRADLRTHNENLLKWVQEGGHLFVNYQKTKEWQEAQDPSFREGRRDEQCNFAPYPLRLSERRVTNERAPVTVLQPEHPIFNMPNLIDASAWEEWVQERGLYFSEKHDARYQPLLAMRDPGEEIATGSTLIAPYGDGTYLYTGLALYRQLSRYHPGAYALFANMISLPFASRMQKETSKYWGR